MVRLVSQEGCGSSHPGCGEWWHLRGAQQRRAQRSTSFFTRNCPGCAKVCMGVGVGVKHTSSKQQSTYTAYNHITSHHIVRRFRSKVLSQKVPALHKNVITHNRHMYFFLYILSLFIAHAPPLVHLSAPSNPHHSAFQLMAKRYMLKSPGVPPLAGWLTPNLGAK